jgi:nitrite reductase/ring-hydroxylating ferredoxin subunit
MTLVRLPAAVRAQAAAQGAVPYTSADGEAYLVVQQSDTWRVFVNQCPHRHLPLDRGGQVYFTADQSLLVCANHGAKFQPLTGRCVAGPCVGKSLRRVPELEESGEGPE